MCIDTSHTSRHMFIHMIYCVTCKHQNAYNCTIYCFVCKCTYTQTWICECVPSERRNKHNMYVLKIYMLSIGLIIHATTSPETIWDITNQPTKVGFPISLRTCHSDPWFLTPSHRPNRRLVATCRSSGGLVTASTPSDKVSYRRQSRWWMDGWMIGWLDDWMNGWMDVVVDDVVVVVVVVDRIVVHLGTLMMKRDE